MRIYILLLVLFTITNASAQWQKESVPESYIYHVEEFDSRLYAFGDSVIYRKNGTVWEPITIVGHDVTALSAIYVEGSHILAGTSNDGVFHSTDAGSTWRRYSAGLASAGLSIIDIERRGDYYYLATSGAGVYATHKSFQSAWEPFNAGLSWTLDYSLNAIKNINGILWISVGGNGFAFYRAEGADSWTGTYIADILPEVTLFPRITLFDGKVCFAGRAGLYTTNDNGSSWVKIPGLPASFYPAMVTHGGTLYYAPVSANGTGGVYKIASGGTEPEELFTAAPYSSGAMAIFENKIYMTSFNGIYSKDLITTGVEPEIFPDEFELTNFYPNPFNGSGIITLTVQAAGLYQFDVYDITGKLIVKNEIAMERGSAKAIPFESGTLPSGSYFIRVSNGSLSKVQKIVLMK